MKKINFLTFILGCLCSIATVSAQTVSLTFTSRDATNNYVQLDSITITNLTKSWQETIYWPDTVLTLTDETGIDEVESNSLKCISYPNPFNNKTSVFLMVLQNEKINLQVYNMSGQRIMEKNVQVEAGESHFEISLDRPQVYFLVANTAHGKFVQKLINIGSSSDKSIIYLGTQEVVPTKEQKLLSSKKFHVGDLLRMTGYVTHRGDVIISNEIQQPQSESEDITLYFTLPIIELPTLTTTIAGSITDMSAISGGTITSDGGAQVTARGVCWSTSQNPTISDNHTTDGSGMGNFTSNITGLVAGTTYYVRAYATNSEGTAYGNEVSFTTNAIVPSLTTIIASNITDSSAVSGGDITNDGGATITARGVCWSTSPNPTINDNYTSDGSGIGRFVSSITGLTAGTTYYVRAYATNAVGTSYGNQITFTTLAVTPIITTTAASNITSTTATSGGNITNDGGSTVTARGICWSTSPNPTINDNYTSDGSGIGSFVSSITGLTAGTTYYVRAYATNAVGTSYGNQITFTTLTVAPIVTTTAASNITSTTATSGGNITSDGGATVTTRGICWSTSPNPTINDNYTSDGSGIGSFVSSITRLAAGTTYYVRAYATNSVGTSYGNQITFTTLAVTPIITTTAASNITSTTATSGGNITSDGGAIVTARGICWSTSSNPTISDSHTTNGSGIGSFTSNMTGLSAGTTYYVRAYATNSVGTSYGNQITFTTLAVAPIVTITAVSNITSTSATTGGNVTNDGGATVTARGICWNTSPNPTINDNYTFDGSGIGSFVSSITGLAAGTTYYVRAYATNSVGTAYSSQVSFTTQAVVPTLTTTVANNITDSSAVSGGNITNDGGASVTARGICWDTTSNPTINKSHTTNGSGTGSFTSNMIGLKASTTYYVRAYATNSAGTAYGNQVTFTTDAKINSPVFSVSATDSVIFSPGNLQWSATNGGNTLTTHVVADNGTAAGTWRFAPNQWDTIGANNKYISSTYTGWIDLFGWGNSGYNNKYPYITSTNYGNGVKDNISSTYYDWGIYNSIYNPKTNTTDAPFIWHALTKDEWIYLLNTRQTPSGIRYAKATVHGVVGLVIVPDNWNNSIYALDSVNTASATYTSNTINNTNWVKLDSAGCVFLPATGRRGGTGVSIVGSNGGGYWSTTSQPDVLPSRACFLNSNFCNFGDISRSYGYAVRLVRSVNKSVQVTTLGVSSIVTDTSAISGGIVISDGGYSITDRGVCWSTSQNPTINDNHTSDSCGIGSFTSRINGLIAGMTYYVRAYATNAVGTTYGNQILFTTLTTMDTSFSVTATTKVLFSPGNLQWSATNGGNSATTHVVAGNGTAAGTWRFAPNQWDTIGAGNSNISSTYTGWIDLFGWSTSGYNNVNPYMTDGGGLYSGQGFDGSDWGVYNAIYNPQTQTTDAPGTWRTLGIGEWFYLLNNRPTSSGIRYAKATVNGVNGLIIVPNNWKNSIYTLDSTNTLSATFASNIINATNWLNMEAAGCVFLPAAGSRSGTTVSSVGAYGYYWSNSGNSVEEISNRTAFNCSFNSYYDIGFGATIRAMGYSVRLVKNVQ